MASFRWILFTLMITFKYGSTLSRDFVVETPTNDKPLYLNISNDISVLITRDRETKQLIRELRDNLKILFEVLGVTNWASSIYEGKQPDAVNRDVSQQNIVIEKVHKYGQLKNISKKNTPPGSKSISNDEESEDNENDPKTTGQLALISQYPFAATYGDCLATILDSQWLITAAHCMTNVEYVRVGSNRKGLGKKYEIAKHILHPLFNPQRPKYSYDYDYQLLKLKKPLKFNKNTQPIEYREANDAMTTDAVRLIGWGQPANDMGSVARSLMWADVPIVDRQSCEDMRQDWKDAILSARMICFGFPLNQVDACFGDGGGPVLINDRLAGIVSLGLGCGASNTPGAYSKISSIRSWLNRYIGL